MPELPEVEIVARRATTALAGRPIARVAVVGVNALRSLDPPPGVLDGTTLTRVLRRGKLLLLDTDGDHLLLMHLMTGGALRWKGASTPRDRSLRLVVTFDDDGPALRLRERGTRQAAWVRAVTRADLLARGRPGARAARPRGLVAGRIRRGGRRRCRNTRRGRWPGRAQADQRAPGGRDPGRPRRRAAADRRRPQGTAAAARAAARSTRAGGHRAHVER